MIHRFLRTHRRFLRVAALALAAHGFTERAVAAEAPRLEPLLNRLARSAMLFRDTALHFACRETITWSGVGMKPGTEGFEYVFVHDDAEGFRDYRTPVFHGKRHSAPREVKPEEYGVPTHLRSAYLWIFAFRESRQALHRYRILGMEEVLGVSAVKIEFEPLPPYRPGVNDWFGVAWVEPELGQLLKVVAYRPEDHAAKENLGAYSVAGLVDEVTVEYQTVTTLYTEERNGLRFPGQVTLDHSRYRLGAVRKRKLLEVQQHYRKYQFFSVRTDQEIRGFILDGRKLDVRP